MGRLALRDIRRYDPECGRRKCRNADDGIGEWDRLGQNQEHV